MDDIVMKLEAWRQRTGVAAGWLLRTDEERGYFLHLHMDPVRDVSGVLTGFVLSVRQHSSELDWLVDDCIVQFERLSATVQ